MKLVETVTLFGPSCIPQSTWWKPITLEECPLSKK